MKEKINRNNLIAALLFVVAGAVNMTLGVVDGNYLMGGLGLVMAISGVIMVIKNCKH